VAPVSGRIVLIALLLGLMALAIWTPWRAVNGADNRTYMEMVRGVRDHGLPYTTSSVVDLAPPSEFNVVRGHALWGEYPPLFAGLAAPALAFGGLAFVYKEVVLALAAVALLVYLLAQRLSTSPYAGACAAVITILGTPLYAASFQTVAQPLAVALVIAAILFAIRSLDDPRPSRWLFFSGIAAGLAVNAHLIATSMTLAMLATLAGLHARDETTLRDRARTAAKRGAVAGAGFAIPVAALSLLNAHRFGTFNPTSYGPCRWKVCEALDHDLTPQGLGAFLAPAIPFVLAVVVGVLVFRRSRLRLAIFGVVMLGVLLIVPWFRFSLGAMLANLFGYFVDPTPIYLADLDPTPDRIGWLRAGNVLKGFLQSCPFAICAMMARPGLRGLGANRALVWAPVLGLMVVLASLARFGGGLALGWPYLFSRYAMYAAPLLVALASAVAMELPMRRAHAALFVAVSVAGVWYLTRVRFDFELSRRLVILYGSLGIAVVTGVALVLRRKVAATLAVVAAGASVAVSTGVDSARSVQNAHFFDHRMERMERVAPQRFALIGRGQDMNPILALRAERDIEYVDVNELVASRDLGRVIERWNQDARPIFAVLPQPPFQGWPNGETLPPMDLVDGEEGYWRLR
jgi:hypothetical protein